MLKNFLIAILVLIGILLGLLMILNREEILIWYKLNFGPADPRQVVAIAKHPDGQISFKLPKKLIYNPLRDGMGLRYGDTISTDENSSVVIAFNDGFEVEVDENSILVLEEPGSGEDGKIVLSFLQGNYRVLKKSSGVLIKKDNRVFKPATDLSKKKIIIAKPTPTPTPSPTPTPVQLLPKDKLDELKRKLREQEEQKRKERETLPDDYISAQIKKQKPLLFRCYIQHLRLNPNVSGRMSVRIDIQPTGKISDVMVTKSSIKDPTLQQCVINVIQRIKFKSYKGDPTIVNYPINFE